MYSRRHMLGGMCLLPLLRSIPAWPQRLYAVIARPPIYGYAVDRLNCPDIPGLITTQTLAATAQTQGGVALIATDHQTALKARDILQVTWKAPSPTVIPHPGLLAQIGPAPSLLDTTPIAAHYAIAWGRNNVYGTAAPNSSIAREAVMLTASTGGQPIQLTWTPADDLPLKQVYPAT